MGFSLFSALGGAAEQYTKMEDEKRRANLEDSRETQRWIRDNATTAFGDWRKKKEERSAIAAQLKAMGLDDAKALGLIDYSPEQAKLFAQNAPAYLGALKASGKSMTANDLITLADPEYTGVSLEEGLDNLAGIYVPTEGAGLDDTTAEGKAYTRLGAALGMDPNELRAITTGDLQRKGGPAIGFSDAYLEMQSLPLRSQITQLEKLKAETTQEKAAASVAYELAGISVDKENAQLDMLTEQITAKRNENSVWKKEQEQIDSRYIMEMRKAADEETKRNIELRYYEEKMQADLAYTRAQTDRAMRPDGSADPGVNMKRFQGAFAVGINAATEMTELGKFLKMVEQPDGSFKATFIGDESSRGQVAAELKDVTQQFLKGVFSTEGAQPAALAAAMSMNPMIDTAIVKATSAQDMVESPYVPFKYKDDEGRFVVGYYDPELGKPVRVSYY